MSKRFRGGAPGRAEKMQKDTRPSSTMTLEERLRSVKVVVEKRGNGVNCAKRKAWYTPFPKGKKALRYHVSVLQRGIQFPERERRGTKTATNLSGGKRRHLDGGGEASFRPFTH